MINDVMNYDIVIENDVLVNKLGMKRICQLLKLDQRKTDLFIEGINSVEYKIKLMPFYIEYFHIYKEEESFIDFIVYQLTRHTVSGRKRTIFYKDANLYLVDLIDDSAFWRRVIDKIKADDKFKYSVFCNNITGTIVNNLTSEEINELSFRDDFKKRMDRLVDNYSKFKSGFTTDQLVDLLEIEADVQSVITPEAVITEEPEIIEEVIEEIIYEASQQVQEDEVFVEEIKNEVEEISFEHIMDVSMLTSPEMQYRYLFYPDADPMIIRRLMSTDISGLKKIKQTSKNFIRINNVLSVDYNWSAKDFIGLTEYLWNNNKSLLEEVVIGTFGDFDLYDNYNLDGIANFIKGKLSQESINTIQEIIMDRCNADTWMKSDHKLRLFGLIK